MTEMNLAGFCRVVSRKTSRRGTFGVVVGLAGLALSPTLGLPGHADAKGKRKKRAVCTAWVLSAAADPNGPDAHIRVDDDLAVSVNDRVVAEDKSGTFTEAGPFVFSAQPGDTLRIVATDVQGGWHELGPLYLRCASGGRSRKLSDGFPRTEGYPDPVGVFFDKTFTI
ncbi:MAG: hypothetical protein U0031_20465 [Thermomicrobiales bacterium]